MGRIVMALALIAGTIAAGSGTVASAETLTFSGAIVAPAGGANPIRPVISRQVVVQTISETDFQVLEIVYR